MSTSPQSASESASASQAWQRALYAHESQETDARPEPLAWDAPPRALLDGAPPEQAPAWLRRLVQVFAEWDAPGAPDLPPGFPRALLPFVAHALRRLPAGAPVGAGPRLAWPPLAPALAAQLGERLLRVAERVLVLELNVARVEERLRGDTPAERFRDYCERLLARPDEWQRLLGEYPVLARLLATTLEQWLAALDELVARLCADWSELSRAWQLDGAALSGLVGGVSDPHRGGRGVYLLDFARADGSHVRLVYKPRPMEVDAAFQGLLAWCNQRAEGLPGFRTLWVHARDGYGFMEFVEREECKSTEEVRRFYLRQGAYLALLHVLGATDFHFENLIAAGEHPVPVDLETLFHHWTQVEERASADARAALRLSDSVLRIGLLPQWALGGAGRAGVNLSGLGDAASQHVALELPGWDAVGTDEMRQVRKARDLMTAGHLPMLDAAPAPASEHVPELTRGFTAMYRVLQREREALRAASGPLVAFAGVEVRHVLRPSQQYAQLLADGVHPDSLRDAVERERALGVLAPLSPQEALRRTLTHELADLRDGDVPVFTARPGSRDLRDSRGTVLPDFFARSSLADCDARLDALGSHDLAWQVFLLETSLRTLSARHAAPAASAAARRAPDVPPGEAYRRTLTEAARGLGERLAASAVLGEDDATWIGVTMADPTRFALGSVGAQLYDGDAGIALFLACLGQECGETRFSELARRVARGLHRRLAGAGQPLLLGGYAGATSQLYALLHCAALLDEPGLLASADVVCGRLLPQVARFACADVLGGLAGDVAALLALDAAGVRGALPLATACGRRLLELSSPEAAGLGWPAQPGTRALLGFAHGVAGIAWALERLAARLEREPDQQELGERLLVAAGAGLAHERAHFDAERRNWPDYRDPKGPAFMSAWCHGAAGVALGRALSAPTPRASAEIALGVETTLRTGLGGDHSLCHGDLGNLLIVGRAARLLERPEWSARVRAEALRVAHEVAAGDARPGDGVSGATPGLMLGLAGIGYGLLSLARLGELPLLLGFEPPLEPARRGRGGAGGC